MKKRFLLGIIIFTIAGTITGCGENLITKKLTYYSYDENGIKYVDKVVTKDIKGNILYVEDY